MDGNFLETILMSTGLPEDEVSAWLKRELLARGKSIENLDEETLRDLLTDMLQELILAN